jgi:diguanylate cyclase (GGDEF)-like protein
MKKILLFIAGIVILTSAMFFTVNETVYNHNDAVLISTYSQRLNSYETNCEGLECNVIRDFRRFNPKEYANNLDDIAESIRPLLDYKNGAKIGVTLLSIAFYEGELNDSQKMLALDKISTLRYRDNDLYGMIEPTLRYIRIAHENGDKLRSARGDLELALIISYFQGYDFASQMIKDMSCKMEGHTPEWYRLKTQAIVSLAENQLAIKQPQEALKLLNGIGLNSWAYNDEDWRDYYIYSTALKAEASLYLNELDKSKKNIELAKLALREDQSPLLLDKSILISVVEFKLAFRMHNFDVIEKNKNYLLSIANTTNQIRYTKMVYKTMFDYYLATDNIKAFYDLNVDYNRLTDDFQSASYHLLISNKLKQSENNNLNDDNEQSMLFLKIGFIALLVTSSLLLVMIVKIKYLNIENDTDPLTRCFNRRKFMSDFDVIAEKEHGFLILDIDNFKSINDCYGHDMGDDVLEKIASVIVLVLGKKHNCYRIGGEEFVVIFRGVSKLTAIEISEDIRTGVEALRWDNSLIVTISGGLSFSATGKVTYKEADSLLYKAKRTTKNTIVNDAY